MSEKSTKERLLEATFEEVYVNGYHGTGLNQILKKAGVNKGSMYHIFKSKKEMMLVVIEELLHQRLITAYEFILEEKSDFMKKTFETLYDYESFDFKLGCPLNNFVQELSPIDDDFKEALEKLYFDFEDLMKRIIDKAIEKDGLKVDDSKAFAVLFIGVIEGAISTGKKSQSPEPYEMVIKEFEKIVNSIY